MQEADTSRTDEGVTVLESGGLLMHHDKDECNGEPCALHNTLEGPWEDWPRFYSATSKAIYRVCPHDVSHPAVEQVIHWLKEGKEYLIPHRCCDQGCICMPRNAVPEKYFNGPRIGVPLSLHNWAGLSDGQKPEVPEITKAQASAPVPLELLETPSEEGSSNEPTGNERDPNWHASQYLYQERTQLNPRFYALLHTNMLEAHQVVDVTPIHAQRFSVSCNDDCDSTLTKGPDAGGKWHRSGGHFCPVVEIALFAGWIPVQWEEGDEEQEEELDD